MKDKVDNKEQDRKESAGKIIKKSIYESFKVSMYMFFCMLIILALILFALETVAIYVSIIVAVFEVLVAFMIARQAGTTYYKKKRLGIVTTGKNATRLEDIPPINRYRGAIYMLPMVIMITLLTLIAMIFNLNILNGILYFYLLPISTPLSAIPALAFSAEVTKVGINAFIIYVPFTILVAVGYAFGFFFQVKKEEYSAMEIERDIRMLR